tara:strand:- start:141 stop:818 length:678 start_codon:yes stop_codon:yes gene_type:complete
MSWKDILKFDEMHRQTTGEFGSELVELLEKTGFEIQYDEAYENYRGSYEEKQKDPYVMRLKRKYYTTATEEEMQNWEAQHADGHELIITDRESPFSYGGGYGTLTLSIKYIEDNVRYYSNPRNEDIDHKKIVDFKIDEVKMTTGAKRDVPVKMNMDNIDNSLSGRRDLLQRILTVFKDSMEEYEEDWGDMSEAEMREERGARAGRRYAGGAWSAGYRDNVWDDGY